MKAVNLGHRIRTRAAISGRAELGADMRSEMLADGQDGRPRSKASPEVASANTNSGMKFDTMTLMRPDAIQIPASISRAHLCKTATFMPKPGYGTTVGHDCHQSIWKDGKPVFARQQIRRPLGDLPHYIGGIIKQPRRSRLHNPRPTPTSVWSRL